MKGFFNKLLRIDLSNQSFSYEGIMNVGVGLKAKHNPSRYLVFSHAVFVVFLGLYFCLVGRGDVFLFGDEFHSIWNLHKPYHELVKMYDTVGSGTALPLVQRFALDVFGVSLWSYRLPAIFGAVATLLVVYPMALRFVGPVPAAVTVLGLAANSIHIFYSRFARTYSMMVFLAVVLVYAVTSVINRVRPRVLWYAVLVLAAGLLPYVHLSAGAFVVGVGVAGVVTLLIKRQEGHLYWLIGSFLMGAFICLVLYLPVWESLQLYLNRTLGGDKFNFGVLDVASVLAGSRVAGVTWLAGVPVAAAWYIVKKRAEALVMIAAVLSPLVSLFVARPRAGAYGYARYLLPALPFMLMLLAWLLVELLRTAGLRRRVANYAGVVLGVVLVVISFLAGPLGLRHTDDGQFANSYLSMVAKPAFDQPWDQTPAFYKMLADLPGQVQIIEAPELLDPSVLLYRNYYLQHKKRVLIGFVTKRPAGIPAGPYVPLWDLDRARDSGADYLILHVSVDKEIAAYWRFVYTEVWPEAKERSAETLRDQLGTLMEPACPLYDVARYLQTQLGQPVYQDTKIVVWKLRR